MRCIKSDLPLALDMLYQVLNKAVISDTEVKKAKQEAIYSIVQSRDNAANVAFEELSDALWKDTPYNRTGKRVEKIIPSITREEVLDYYKTAFDAKNTIIAINGDVDSCDMINYFSEAISKNNRKIVNYSDYKNLFKPLNSNKIVTKQQGKEAAWVVFAWQCEGIADRKIE